MSAEDPRDRAFDDLLRRAPLAHTTSSAACVDAETLAAWSDGTLRADAARTVEAHLAGCARCQRLVAAFARTDSTPGRARPETADVLDGRALDATRPDPFWRRWRLAWLAPVAATATALAVWVATPRTPLDPAHRPEASSEASGAAPAGQAADAPSGARREVDAATAPPGSAAAVREPDAERTEETAARRPMPASEPASGRAAQPGAPPAPPRELAKAEGSAPAAEFRQMAPAGPASPGPASAQAGPAGAANGAAADFAPEVNPRSDEVQGRAAAVERMPPAPDARLVDLPPPAPAELLERRSRAASPAAPQVRGLTLTTDAGLQWRVRVAPDAASADFSQDRGRSWAPVSMPAGVLRDIDAGIAAGGRVCWLVGRRGLVLLSTDGPSFRRVPFPVAIDLRAVEAADARAAVVVAGDGRRFATTDGGASWAAVP
ncbi:MAG: zf-HC2 domain-containing protein [Vicinamibacterales bacterium]